MNVYNEKAMKEAIRMLQTKPYTALELAFRFGKTERTIKRWMNEMRERGHRVVRDGVDLESPYMIVETDMAMAG